MIGGLRDGGPPKQADETGETGQVKLASDTRASVLCLWASKVPCPLLRAATDGELGDRGATVGGADLEANVTGGRW